MTESILGLVIARDEEVTLPEIVSRFKSESIPFIAVLDNPTKSVRETLKGALDTYELPPFPPGRAHVYRWAEILRLVDFALRRPRGFTWAFRVDADELWPGVRKAVSEAAGAGADVISAGIRNHAPVEAELKSTHNLFKACPVAESGHPLYLPERGNHYHRIWRLDSGQWFFGAGGHQILGRERKVFESPLVFDHFPAVDLAALDRKISRLYLPGERKVGWHNQYDALLAEKNKAEAAAEIEGGPIHVFFHVARMGAWEKIYREQVESLKASGLLKNAEITVCTVGENNRLPPAPIPGAEMVYGGTLDKFEFPTLKRAWQWAKENPAGRVLYLHTKGASRGHEPANSWRRYMQWGVVESWRRCVCALKSFDMSGVEWTGSNDLFSRGVTDPTPVGFWAGNFWWARGEYLAKLPDPESLDVSNRYYAEAWAGLSKAPRVRCFHDTRDVFNGKRGWCVPGWNRNHYAGV